MSDWMNLLKAMGILLSFVMVGFMVIELLFFDVLFPSVTRFFDELKPPRPVTRVTAPINWNEQRQRVIEGYVAGHVGPLYWDQIRKEGEEPKASTTGGQHVK